MNPRSNKPIPPPMKPGNGWPWRAKTGHGLPNNLRDEAAKISIVIPSYNQGRFLEATIRSVLLQDYPSEKVECIVIDGGRTDESKEILDYYSPWLTYWGSEPDRGQSHAINKGLARATGELRGFLNSDDFYMPGAFQSIAGLHMKMPEAILVYGNRVLVDEAGVVLGIGLWPLFDHKLDWCNIKSETAFWTKAGQEAVGLIDEALQFAMDTDYFLRLYRHGSIAKTEQCIGAYRSHSKCKSATIFEEGMKEAAFVWERVFGTEFQSNIAIHHKGRLAALFCMMREPRGPFLPWLRGRTSRLVKSLLGSR